MILLKGGKAFVDGKLISKDILIEKGKISKIADDLVDDSAVVIDCIGKVILPGIIDPHVHFREPGLTHKEDFFSGSRAAAAGGITTVLDMPNTKPATLTIKNLDEKRKLASAKSVVNFGFHFGSTIDNLSEIKKARGVASTKIFMNLSTGNMKIEDEKQLERIFLASKVVSVHAEGDKVELAVRLAKKTNTRLYLCHISSASEISFLKKVKSKNIFIEVTPHHLYLTYKNDPFLDVRPALKNHKDIKALWDAINSNIVDTIGTDHAPHTIAEKKGKNPPSGMPGEETLIPLMLDAVNKKKITLKRLVELVAVNPSKIFGIKDKGYIKKGYDADLVVVDMNLARKVDAKRLYTKCKWSPYNKKLLKGWPVYTIVNGNIVFDGGIINKYKGREVEYERGNR